MDTALSNDEIVKKIFFEYDSICRITNILYEVRKDGKKGIFSIEKESLILPVEYFMINYHTDSLFWVENHGVCGIFSVEKESPIVPIEYGYIKNLTDTLYEVRKDGVCGIFSVEKESLILSIEHDSIERLTDALYLIMNELPSHLQRRRDPPRRSCGGKYGLFSVEKESLILPVEYGCIKRLTDTLYEIVNGSMQRGIFSLETLEVTWKD